MYKSTNDDVTKTLPDSEVYDECDVKHTPLVSTSRPSTADIYEMREGDKERQILPRPVHKNTKKDGVATEGSNRSQQLPSKPFGKRPKPLPRIKTMSTDTNKRQGKKEMYLDEIYYDDGYTEIDDKPSPAIDDYDFEEVAIDGEEIESDKKKNVRRNVEKCADSRVNEELSSEKEKGAVQLNKNRQGASKRSRRLLIQLREAEGSNRTQQLSSKPFSNRPMPLPRIKNISTDANERPGKKEMYLDESYYDDAYTTEDDKPSLAIDDDGYVEVSDGDEEIESDNKKNIRRNVEKCADSRVNAEGSNRTQQLPSKPFCKRPMPLPKIQIISMDSNERPGKKEMYLDEIYYDLDDVYPTVDDKPSLAIEDYGYLEVSDGGEEIESDNKKNIRRNVEKCADTKMNEIANGRAGGNKLSRSKPFSRKKKMNYKKLAQSRKRKRGKSSRRIFHLLNLEKENCADQRNMNRQGTSKTSRNWPIQLWEATESSIEYYSQPFGDEITKTEKTLPVSHVDVCEPDYRDINGRTKLADKFHRLGGNKVREIFNTCSKKYGLDQEGIESDMNTQELSQSSIYVVGRIP